MGAIIFALIALARADAEAQALRGPLITVSIDSVLAADTKEGTDPRLPELIKRQLPELFGYSTYRLVSHQVITTNWGRELDFMLPGGRMLRVDPQNFDGHMVAMAVLLFDGERPVMSTDFKLENGGDLMLGGHRYDNGMLIVTIGVKTESAPNVSAPPDAQAPSTENPGTPRHQ
ncbi:MAG TPA: hypothetical protein VGI47_07205 [Candidatus Binataceae bacterium]|jgi:hypothetical protein